MNLGPMELIVILVVALLIFGPKNLPKLGKSLGQTVKNVREGMEGDMDEETKKVEAPKATEVVADADEVARGVHGTDERITRRAYLQGIRFFIRLIQETML